MALSRVSFEFLLYFHLMNLNRPSLWTNLDWHRTILGDFSDHRSKFTCLSLKGDFLWWPFIAYFEMCWPLLASKLQFVCILPATFLTYSTCPLLQCPYLSSKDYSLLSIHLAIQLKGQLDRQVSQISKEWIRCLLMVQQTSWERSDLRWQLPLSRLSFAFLTCSPLWLCCFCKINPWRCQRSPLLCLDLNWEWFCLDFLPF